MQPYLEKTSIDNLEKTDFQFFYLQFKKVLEENVPFFANLFFLHSSDSSIDFIGSFQTKQIIDTYFSSFHKRKNFSCCRDGCIFLAIPTKDSATLAVITGIDSYFAKKVAADWLKKLTQSLLERYLLIKCAGIDLETGLLNSQQFFANLCNMTGNISPSVLLIEAYPQARSALQAKIHTSKVVTSLNNSINGKLPLYYLGHDVFALQTIAVDDKKFLKLGKSLLSWLRKDGLSRVHIGLRYSREMSVADFGPVIMTGPADQAWFALQTARRRGPFSLCDFDLLSHPEKHPLRRPSKSLLAKFRRKWLASEVFSVVQFQPSDNKVSEAVKRYLNDEIIICDNDDIYCFLNNHKPKQALQWATSSVSAMDIDGVKVGVAYYPHNKFKKSTTVINCRKALHHASLLGDNEGAVFNSISLNVSGDMYYAEGDLISAVREYRCGLDCDPTDINLLNSLGVTYGDMAKNREARKCFKMALSFDPRNFMALFNLGLCEDLIGRADESLQYFERAYKTSPEIFDEAKEDLQFQLGKLYCITGKYRESAKILQSWYESSRDRISKGKSLPFLGRAFYHLGLFEEAMTWLQRALRYNEFDAESLGLLGVIYLLRQEGDEIALSLCVKSVDLNPDSVELKLYLARVQIACKLYNEAKINLKKCLRNKTTRVDAQLYYCICYQKEGSYGRAKYWLDKVFKNKRLDKRIWTQARKLGEVLDAI